MSTRATYQFEVEYDGRGTGKVTFYIHHDGYPKGAAEYFKLALEYKAEAPNATLADRFIKANARAEITPSHEYHGDTEYRYSVNKEGILTVQTFLYPDGYGTREQWVQKWKGSIPDFIAEFAQ